MRTHPNTCTSKRTFHPSPPCPTPAPPPPPPPPPIPPPTTVPHPCPTPPPTTVPRPSTPRRPASGLPTMTRRTRIPTYHGREAACRSPGGGAWGYLGLTSRFNPVYT